jgi:hypothetical protein
VRILAQTALVYLERYESADNRITELHTECNRRFDEMVGIQAYAKALEAGQVTLQKRIAELTAKEVPHA